MSDDFEHKSDDRQCYGAGNRLCEVRLRLSRQSSWNPDLGVGPVEADGDGWSCQLTGTRERSWTIRVRTITMAGGDFYECWVNDDLLPIGWRREPSTEEACMQSICDVAMLHIYRLL